MVLESSFSVGSKNFSEGVHSNAHLLFDLLISLTFSSIIILSKATALFGTEALL